ncbi:MAG TPA: AMP-binding protein [Geobacteraceae bacterium]
MVPDIVEHDQYNIGYICTHRQCRRGLGNTSALRWISHRFERQDYTFADLDGLTNRFANVLTELGLRKGDVVFTFLPKMPEQFVAFLGGLKAQCITGTLFSNLGDDALLDRLADSGARLVVTSKSLYRKIERIRARLPQLRTVILIDVADDLSHDLLSWGRMMTAAHDDFATPVTPPETPSVLHYTSGSTGKPKGVLHCHKSVMQQARTAHEVLGLQRNDLYWCTADQGWVTGTSYGIIGPWSLGVTQLHFGGTYDAGCWLDLIARQGVTVWYTAPTALRMLMREEPTLFLAADLSSIRSIFSVGEPLNPEVISWARKTLGKDIFDTWFQTETGAIMIANCSRFPVRPGSMGKPVQGVEPAILADDGTICAAGEHGNLCIKQGWDSMFATYLNNSAAYEDRFKNSYYYTGDMAWRDDDGYYWFLGRSDDVINTSGHLVSPFEVESTLLELPEVVESAAIAAPDDLLFEKVVAFVHLKADVTLTPELMLKIRLHVANRLSSVAIPQEIIPVEEIPKNKSGKIMRRVMKSRYLGQDEGDITMLEEYGQ